MYGSENGGDIKIGPCVFEDLKMRMKQARLSLKFILGSLKGYDGSQSSKLTLLDQFILNQTALLETRVKKMYSNYEYRHAINEILQYLRSPFSSTYVVSSSNL